jgi:hypothetical protein
MAPDRHFYFMQVAFELRKSNAIDPHQVCMANAAKTHFGLDLGRFVQWMGGKYMGQH